MFLLNIEDKIKLALEDNIMVFDDEAKPFVITYKLIALMQKVHAENYNELITDIYADFGTTWQDIEHYRDNIAGIKIWPAKINITDKYKELGGTLPTVWMRKDKNEKLDIILGIGQNKAILGAV